MKLFEVMDTLQYDIIKQLMKDEEVHFKLNDALHGAILDIRPSQAGVLYQVSYYAINEEGVFSRQISKTNLFCDEIEDGRLSKVKDGVWMLDMTPTEKDNG